MQDSFGILNEIVRSKNIFVFRKDLEGTLQHPQTPKRQKPLRDLERITELILGDNVPEEFCEMATFASGLDKIPKLGWKTFEPTTKRIL